MMNLRDAELLRLHAETGDETAFGELVARHVDLVYSAALRQVGGDSALAQDVSQSVFILLARQARALSRRASILGWLYTTARYQANHAVRAERRRRNREQEATAMHEFESTPDINWEELHPVLDAAMHELSESDREVMLLRYFKGLELRAVGAAVGVSEEAARKRVDRALEKLRGVLRQRGVASTSAALVAVMHGAVVTAAPAGLASTITTAVATGAVAGAGFTTTLFQFMASTKIKSTAGAVLLAGLLAPVVMQQRSLSSVRTETETLRQSVRDFSAPTQPVAAAAEPLSDAEREEFARLQRDHLELLRLRGEVGRRLRAAEAQKEYDRKMEAAQAGYQREVVARRDELNKCTETKLTGGFKLAEARNVGSATPEATLQSFVAAVVNNDAQGLAELQWSGFLPAPFTPEDLVNLCEARLWGLRGMHTEDVSGINLYSLRKYAADRVEILYDFETEQPRKIGRPAGGRLLLRLINGQWLLEYALERMPQQLERMRWPAPVIEAQN
jgi:RNA polymerase sigma factor (sigma-70 family)